MAGGLLASPRTGGRVTQHIVRHVGIAMDDDKLVRLKELAEYIKTNMEQKQVPSLFQPEQTDTVGIGSPQEGRTPPSTGTAG